MQDQTLTEYLIPVLCTGIKYKTVHAKDAVEAGRIAQDKVDMEMRYSSDAMSGLTCRALAPELALRPEDRESWPYWAYGWHGTDGVDWRQYRTDKGIGAIPDIAEESWPIPAFD